MTTNIFKFPYIYSDHRAVTLTSDKIISKYSNVINYIVSDRWIVTIAGCNIKNTESLVYTLKRFLEYTVFKLDKLFNVETKDILNNYSAQFLDMYYESELIITIFDKKTNQVGSSYKKSKSILDFPIDWYPLKEWPNWLIYTGSNYSKTLLGGLVTSDINNCIKVINEYYKYSDIFDDGTSANYTRINVVTGEIEHFHPKLTFKDYFKPIFIKTFIKLFI